MKTIRAGEPFFDPKAAVSKRGSGNLYHENVREAEKDPPYCRSIVRQSARSRGLYAVCGSADLHEGVVRTAINVEEGGDA